MSGEDAGKISLGRPGAGRPARDPVCGMLVDPARPGGGSHEHAGKTYFFCNPGCREKFVADPETYLAAGASMAQMGGAEGGDPGARSSAAEHPPPAGSLAAEKDPVCGMDVDTETSQLSLEHDGKTYWFCGKGCLLEFKDDPDKYLDPGYQPEAM
jgi:Cu+-exporting ATPase